MVFNLGKNSMCRKCTLEPISGGETIELGYVQFRKTSVEKIADIMKNGVNSKNNKLTVDLITCKKDDFHKLKDKRYKATFRALADVGNDVVTLIEFVLGNIEISFDIRNANLESDTMKIKLAEITTYPFGENNYKEIDD